MFRHVSKYFRLLNNTVLLFLHINSSSKSKDKSKDEKEKIKSENQEWSDVQEPMQVCKNSYYYYAIQLLAFWQSNNNSTLCLQQVDIPDIKHEIKEESEDGYAGANNTTVSSCDYSLSQFKDDPLSELPPEEDSADEGDTSLVRKYHLNIFKQEPVLS